MRPASCLHSLLPQPRSTAITSRLTSSQILLKVHTRTKRYCSFIQNGLWRNYNFWAHPGKILSWYTNRVTLGPLYTVLGPCPPALPGLPMASYATATTSKPTFLLLSLDYLSYYSLLDMISWSHVYVCRPIRPFCSCVSCFDVLCRPADCAVAFYEWRCIIHWLIVLY